MDSDLKAQYIRALFRLKKRMYHTFNIPDVNMAELHVMMCLYKNKHSEDCHLNMAEIQNRIFVTKQAVSKMLTSLEKKGYIIRETDKNDRRKIIVELTKRGEEVVGEASKQFDIILDKIFAKFGEENTRQLIFLLERLSDIKDEI